MSDTVRPDHYKGDGMEAMDIIRAYGYGEGFALGNTLKYVLRYAKTRNTNDLRKARQYLDFEIAAAVERDNEQYRMDLQARIQELAK